MEQDLLSIQRMLVKPVAFPSELLALLEKDYGSACVRLAWGRIAKERYLLFAVVELIPHELPPPEDDGEQSQRLTGSSHHYVYFRHVIVSPRRAMNWYRSAAAGYSVIPANDGTLPTLDAHGVKVAFSLPMLEEPNWPELVTATGNIPFLAGWHLTPRVHHLLANVDPTKRWTPRERVNAAQWLSDRLYFNLNEWSEQWGSVHLIAPDPVCRVVQDQVPVGYETGENDKVIVRAVPREKCTVNALQVHVRLERVTGGVTIHAGFDEAKIIEILTATRLEKVGITVLDPQRGVLMYSPPLFFFRGVSVSTSTGGAPRRVEVPPVGDRPAEVYVVHAHGGREIPSEVATPVLSASRRLYLAQAAVEERNKAKLPTQAWFGTTDDRERATQIIRDLVRVAQQRVILVDPYAMAVELRRYALAVANVQANVLFLTSAEVLRKDASWTPNMKAGTELLQELRNLKVQSDLPSVEVRVMPGERPDIHDRFLCVDSQIWILGSSLNEFGSRGTMLVRLPAPGPVLKEIEEVWDRCQLLSEWVEARSTPLSQNNGMS